MGGCDGDGDGDEAGIIAMLDSDNFESRQFRTVLWFCMEKTRTKPCSETLSNSDVSGEKHNDVTLQLSEDNERCTVSAERSTLGASAGGGNGDGVGDGDGDGDCGGGDAAGCRVGNKDGDD